MITREGRSVSFAQMGAKYSITGMYLLSAISCAVTGVNISENMKLVQKPSGQSRAVPPKKTKKKKKKLKSRYIGPDIGYIWQLYFP